jgi:hypothetical protein
MRQRFRLVRLSAPKPDNDAAQRRGGYGRDCDDFRI